MKTLLFLIALLLFLCGPVVPVWAVVDGSVEWRYTNYEKDSKSGDDFSASSFTQNYSVLYR